MALSSTSNRISFTGDAVVVTFSYNYLLLDAAHLEVYLDGVLQSSGYTVDPVGIGSASGGDVTFAVAPGSGVTVLFLRVVPLTQLTDYVEADKFPADTHERALDLLTMQNQQQNEEIGRSITWPVTVESASNTLPDPALTANKGKALFIANDGLSIESRAVDANDSQAVNTTKGDLATFDTDHVRLPVGANDSVLVPDSAEAKGLKYVQGITTRGDLWTQGASGHARLAIGTVGEGLMSDGTDLVWNPADNRMEPIINGGMQVVQRATSTAAAANGTWAADRFQYAINGTMVHTVSRESGIVDAGLELPNAIKLDCTTADTDIDAANYTFVQHRVEGYRALSLFGKTITISFWVYSTKTGTFCVAFRNSGADRSYVAEYTVSTTNTWERKSITLAIPDPNAGGTWNITNGIGLTIQWSLATGSTFHTTADAWQTGNYFATSNQVNACDDVANNWMLTGVQIDIGSVMKPFRSVPFDIDLQACQRYFQKNYEYATAPGATGHVWGLAFKCNSTAHIEPVVYKTYMRTVPTVTLYNPNSGAAGTWRDNTGGADKTVAAGSQSDNGFIVTLTASVDNNTVYGNWVADAEL